MEDLLPLLIFIVIAVINALKYLAEKGGGKAPPKPQPEKPARGPSSLEEFFEDIARKFEPKPRDVADWPQGVERPDYVAEMQTFETAPAPDVQAETAAPEMAPAPAPPHRPPPAPQKTPAPIMLGRTQSVKIPAQAAAFASMSSSTRISMQPLLRSATGHTTFELKNKQQLKQALIAGMIFGTPRAYEQSFNNTMAQ